MKLKKATLILRRSQVTQFKPDAGTRQLLGQKTAIHGGNYAGLRVATNGLAIVQQDDRLTITGKLDGSKGDAFGNNSGGRGAQGRSLESKAHAVGLVANRIAAGC